MLITLEGIDRSGKSTQARLLAEALGPDCLAVREPGGTPVGERVRDLVKDTDVAPTSRTEAILFAAARAELAAEVIAPALADGRTVVCDRFLDSSLAYQGVGRGLGVAEVEELNRFGIGDLRPNLTLLLDIEARAAAGRTGESDRFEAEGLELQTRVARAYRALADAEPRRWRVIDADRPEAEVHSDVMAAVGAAR
jgi:dTMP kinase